MLTFVMVSDKKRIILSVSNDLNSDQRLHKVCTSLLNHQYEPILIGRFLKGRSKPIERAYECKRFQLWFNNGPLFYMNLNVKLFFYLLRAKADILIANDLDTLPANYLAAKLSGKELVYDSHEYFTEVPELIDRPFVQSIWKRIESFLLPKIKYAYTVSPSIAATYEEMYGLKMQLVRNFPLLVSYEDSISTIKKEVSVIYQGALNAARGIEELIDAFSKSELQNESLWILGEGDIEEELKNKVDQLGIQSRVTFLGRIPLEKLSDFTVKARIGVSLERSISKNYDFALPNKVFDYIQLGVPVLYSPLKDLSELVKELNIGEELQSHHPEELAKQISQMLHSNRYEEWVVNCKNAAPDLSWQNEEKVLLKLIDDVRKD